MKKHLFFTVLLYVLHLSAASGQTPTREKYDSLMADCDSELEMKDGVSASKDQAVKKLTPEYGARFDACTIALDQLGEKLNLGKYVPPKLRQLPDKPQPLETVVEKPLVVQPIPEKPAEKPLMLRRLIDDEMERLTWEHPGWRQSSVDSDACGILVRVHLSCSLNTLRMVSVFLTINGKGLFLSGIGTYPNDGFTGAPEQIAYLIKVIEHNRGVFTWGELTASDVQYKWQPLPQATKATKRAKR